MKTSTRATLRRLADRFGQGLTARSQNVREMLMVVDAVANMRCCCPVHGAAFSGDQTDKECPYGDCDGCPSCLSGIARRIITRIDEEGG